MSPTTKIAYELVDAIPTTLDQGVVYISQRYATAAHLCACGCGLEVVTPLGAGGWRVQIDKGAVSMHPSIGNWSFPCRSHYIITRGRILWAGDYTKEMVAAARLADNPRAHQKLDFWGRAIKWFKDFFG